MKDKELKTSNGSNEDNDNQNQEQRDMLKEYGQMQMPNITTDIFVINVIGQVEGHLVMPPQNKTTKYEHIIPQLVAVEQDDSINAVLIILNTVGGDVEAGLAIAEMISTISKPTVSLVLGGGHSIGVPIAVSTDYSLIAPTATMTLHPIRLTGLVIGAQQSFNYFDRMQDRVISFIVNNSKISEKQLRSFMTNTGELAQDIGTIVVGEDAVDCGLIDEVGGISSAIKTTRQLINLRKTCNESDDSEVKKQC